MFSSAGPRFARALCVIAALIVLAISRPVKVAVA